jgi:Ca-activated chloride channel family protein
MVNYFRYHYTEPKGKDPVAIRIDSASAPWSPEHRLVRIAIKAKEVDLLERSPSNLVFLIDVSGSMEPENKLPLLKSALRLLLDKLSEKDRISMVVYAGASGLVLPPTSGSDRPAILAALDRLQAGGSTNGASGIQLAYETAEANFITGGINRVVLATDGDFNVGITSQGDLIRLIQDKSKSGVFLSVLGFGMGNYKDSTLEKLADKGNGNYAYIDTLNEARKVLVEQMSGTLITVAKDVKLQIEFNPAEVGAYRLIGYENRALNHEDFNDDTKDAGDIGAGHAVTALFDVIPRGVPIPAASVDELKYQKPSRPNSAAGSRELLTIKLRYKEPDGKQSRLLEVPFLDTRKSFSQADQDFRFAASVAAFGMILRESPYKGNSRVEEVLEIARESLDGNEDGYKAEFIQLVEKARSIAPSRKR